MKKKIYIYYSLNKLINKTFLDFKFNKLTIVSFEKSICFFVVLSTVNLYHLITALESDCLDSGKATEK